MAMSWSAALFFVIVVLPLVGITIAWLLRNPFSGAMFGAMQLMTIVGIGMSLPTIEADMPFTLQMGFLSLGPTTVRVSTAGSGAGPYVLLLVAVVSLLVGAIGYLLMLQIQVRGQKPTWLKWIASWFGGPAVRAPKATVAASSPKAQAKRRPKQSVELPPEQAV